MHITGSITATLSNGASKTYVIGSMKELKDVSDQLHAIDSYNAKYAHVDAFIKERLIVTGNYDDQVSGTRLTAKFEEWKAERGLVEHQGRNFLYQRVRDQACVISRRPNNLTVFAGIKLLSLPKKESNKDDGDELI